MIRKIFVILFMISFILVPLSSASARSPWDRSGGWYGPGAYSPSSWSRYGNRGSGRNDWFGRGFNDAWGDSFSNALGDVFGDFFGDAEIDITFRVRGSGKAKGRGKGRGYGRSAGDYRSNYSGGGYSDYQGYSAPRGYYGGVPRYRRW